MNEPHASVHRLEQQRRENRDAVTALGLRPYGGRTPNLVTTGAARAMHSDAADLAVQNAGKTPPAGFVDPRARVSVAGRVMLLRDNGKLVWFSLRDHAGDIQVAASQKDLPPDAFELAKRTDLGDLLVAHGRVMKTRTGEVTVWADGLLPAAKSLVPPPEKWSGLSDTEIRYRQRYVDLWANPGTLRVFERRAAIIGRVRRFLESRGFVEVETPMLQPLAGGAAARPFRTHLNALDIDLFLRIAPELYLKRLLVGGMPRVFEVNRNFRNEGVDRSHNPEFTSLEVYEAFGDYTTMMELTESLVRDSAAFVASLEGLPGPVLPFGDLNIDFGSPFARVGFSELFERSLGFPLDDIERARAEAVRRGLKSGAADDMIVVNDLFEAVAEPTLDPARPTFVVDYPAALSPLTRPKDADPKLAERWDLFIAGMEIGPAYTELNDPDLQERMFRQQLAGVDDEEATFRTFDADFVRALKVGMPPAGGMGLGIDRLVMLLTNQRSIRDVLLFPFMRPEA